MTMQVFQSRTNNIFCKNWYLLKKILFIYHYNCVVKYQCIYALSLFSVLQQTVLASVQHEDPTFTGDGYVSLCIIYAVFALGSWVAPSIVAIIGAKWGMILSASVYLVFIAQFISPSTFLLYVTSALLGGAASVLWCCQGNFLTLASDPKTISRNSGVFWGINQCR